MIYSLIVVLSLNPAPCNQDVLDKVYKAVLVNNIRRIEACPKPKYTTKSSTCAWSDKACLVKYYDQELSQGLTDCELRSDAFKARQLQALSDMCNGQTSCLVDPYKEGCK